MIFAVPKPKPAPTPEGPAGDPKSTPRVVVLGPQGLKVTVDEVIGSLDLPDGPIATITAGWQEREPEEGELDSYLGGRSRGLHLYQRLERVFGRDPELADAHRAKQKKLRELRRLYNIRLTSAMDAVLTLLKESGDPDLVDPEREVALAALCEIDSWHLGRIERIWGEFLEEFRPLERDALAREREEVRKLLDESVAVVVTGGHVAVLLNRLRLFNVRELLRGKIIVAWSAGAMVLSERVVLFHDSPPQGHGHAEVFEEGLGIYERIVALPHGRRRLRLDDKARVARFARRFAPARCVLLDAGTRLDWIGGRWTAGPGADVLSVDGSVTTVSEW